MGPVVTFIASSLGASRDGEEDTLLAGLVEVLLEVVVVSEDRAVRKAVGALFRGRVRVCGDGDGVVEVPMGVVTRVVRVVCASGNDGEEEGEETGDGIVSGQRTRGVVIAALHKVGGVRSVEMLVEEEEGGEGEEVFFVRVVCCATGEMVLAGVLAVRGVVEGGFVEEGGRVVDEILDAQLD